MTARSGARRPTRPIGKSCSILSTIRKAIWAHRRGAGGASMNPDCFLDTNILFYAAMGRFSDPKKYLLARPIMAETNFAVSGQVLQEFYVNVTKKSDKPLTSEQAIQWMNRLIDRPCAAIDHELVVRGAEIASRYKISYWDGSIVAGAER